MAFEWQAVIRLVLAMVVGIVIGSERARHGRAAGMRTHILVCLGAALTALVGIYAQTELENDGDMMRLAAQVISGIGFLGAGMIILKNNNVILGLTTAAGVWTTGIIGIAIGFGFYWGALVATVLLLLSLVLFARLEKRKKSVEVIYFEIDDMYSANATIEIVSTIIQHDFVSKILPPKSGFPGHLGINIIVSKRCTVDLKQLLAIDHVVFAEEEE